MAKLLVALFVLMAVACSVALDMSAVFRDVADHQQDALRIIAQATKVSKGQSYDRLATFTDTFGNRISGSDNLERAIDYVVGELKREGFDDVHTEDAQVPYWVRGNEYVTMLSPQRNHKVAMLGLGNSVSTNGAVIKAEAIVVKTFEELRAKAALNLTQGKIVVFNQYCNWTQYPVACYGMSVNYRGSGAVEAAKAGAVAALIRSVAAFSIDSPHTGMMTYDDKVKKIPNACISIEDAEMMERMQVRSQKIELEMYMEAETHPMRTSRNIIADWRGTQYPNEVVVVSGHIDSWDVGQGAMDDGCGAFISWEAISLLKQLNLRPKRTVRLIMWTCEEYGGYGGRQYFNTHKGNASLFDLFMESDMGVFLPKGIEFTGTAQARQIMVQIGQLLTSINATQVFSDGGGTDVDPWTSVGVPVSSLATYNDRYFWFHHSNGDTMTVLDPTEMDLSSAVWAVTAYVVADLDAKLPR